MESEKEAYPIQKYDEYGLDEGYGLDKITRRCLWEELTAEERAFEIEGVEFFQRLESEMITRKALLGDLERSRNQVRGDREKQNLFEDKIKIGKELVRLMQEFSKLNKRIERQLNKQNKRIERLSKQNKKIEPYLASDLASREKSWENLQELKEEIERTEKDFYSIGFCTGLDAFQIEAVKHERGKNAPGQENYLRRMALVKIADYLKRANISKYDFWTAGILYYWGFADRKYVKLNQGERFLDLRKAKNSPRKKQLGVNIRKEYDRTCDKTSQ